LTRIAAAPDRFDGNLIELYAEWAKKVLLPRSSVEDFHHLLVSYLKSADPLFLTRTVSGQQRGLDIRTREGHRLRATDNSPAWWIHAKLFDRLSVRREAFASFIESVPCHMFNVRLADSINSAGWHVAHVFEAKDRNTDYQHWNRDELSRRMVRNIHPCNYFYLPKTDWRVYGGEPAVIAFFHRQFAERYSSVWDEFIQLVGGYAPIAPGSEPSFRYRIPVRPTATAHSTGTREFAARYEYSRLAFKADVIESLALDESFRVDTPQGSYAMTKRDFYRIFPLIPVSRSYARDRLYSYPTPPRRAEQFRISRKTF
jgi:hypothetical protein